MPAPEAVARPLDPDPRPSTSSLLDDDDEPEDVDLEEEGAAGEVVTQGSVVAKADWISRKSSSSLSGSIALYSRMGGGFVPGAIAERG